MSVAHTLTYTHPSVTTKNVSRHCQIFPMVQTVPRWEPPTYNTRPSPRPAHSSLSLKSTAPCSLPPVRAESLQPNLCGPVDCGPPVSPVPGILQGGLPRPPPGDLPDPGVGPVSLESPALAGGFSTTSPTWEAPTSPLRLLKTFSTGLPWWLSGKEFTYQYRRRGSSPGPGRWKIPHAAGQLSPCTWSPRATVMKPTLEPVLCNKRRQHGEKPAHLY